MQESLHWVLPPSFTSAIPRKNASLTLTQPFFFFQFSLAYSNAAAVDPFPVVKNLSRSDCLVHDPKAKIKECLEVKVDLEALRSAKAIRMKVTRKKLKRSAVVAGNICTLNLILL